MAKARRMIYYERKFYTATELEELNQNTQLRKMQSIERVRETMRQSLSNGFDRLRLFRQRSRAFDGDLRLLLPLIADADSLGVFHVDVVSRGRQFGLKPRKIIAALRRAEQRNEILRLAKRGPESNRYQIILEQ
jgi:hypothetical protein